MEIDYRYDLPEAEALARIKVLGEYLDNRHGIKLTWLDANRAAFNGKYLVVDVKGEMSVGSGLVKFRGKDPGFLWRRKASEYIEGKLKAYLDPATPLDRLARS
jgi:hypothetical protein